MNCKVCGNTSSKNPSVSFFRFPKENTKCREWAVRCNLLSLYERHGTLGFYKSFRICSDHFDAKDIVFDGRKKRLLQCAVPQILIMSQSLKKGQSEDAKKFCDGDTSASCQLINTNVECQKKVDWDSGADQILNKTSNFDSPVKVQVPPDLMMCFSGNVSEEYYDQVLQDNFINENDSFLKKSQPNLVTTSQSTRHTNFSKEVDIRRNVSFEHDYSNVVSRNQLQFETKKETENDQSFVEEAKHQCVTCLEAFENSKVSNAHSLKKSVRSDLSTESFCESRNEVLSSRFEFDDHTSRHSEGNHSCKICDKKFHKVAFLDKPTVSHSLKNSCDCFTDLRTSQTFPKPHDKTRSKCFPNQNKSNFFSELNSKTLKLKKNSFKSPKRRCRFCDRFFKNRQLCFVHEKTHTGETPYECKECGKAFRSKPSLRQHRSVHSDKRLYNCQECGMSFKRKDTLSNHLRIHTGERPFVCKVCGFAFKQRGDCMKHEKNHAKVLEFETKEEELQSLNKNDDAGIVGSATTNFITDSSQTRCGIFWNEENNSLLPSYKTKPEEITPVVALEDIVSNRLTPFNFLM